jgi:hypothetical protein
MTLEAMNECADEDTVPSTAEDQESKYNLLIDDIRDVEYQINSYKYYREKKQIDEISLREVLGMRVWSYSAEYSNFLGQYVKDFKMSTSAIKNHELQMKLNTILRSCNWSEISKDLEDEAVVWRETLDKCETPTTAALHDACSLLETDFNRLVTAIHIYARPSTSSSGS